MQSEPFKRYAMMIFVDIIELIVIFSMDDMLIDRDNHSQRILFTK